MARKPRVNWPASGMKSSRPGNSGLRFRRGRLPSRGSTTFPADCSTYHDIHQLLRDDDDLLDLLTVNERLHLLTGFRGGFELSLRRIGCHGDKTSKFSVYLNW